MSDAKTNWDTASAVYHKAARELENAAEPYVAELVRKHYPTAVKLITIGEMNEDYVDVLRCERVILADGSVVGETTDEGFIDERFEAMSEDVEEVLSWLIDLDPDSYLNETEFDLGSLVS
jgi:hypothetical protein